MGNPKSIDLSNSYRMVPESILRNIAAHYTELLSDLECVRTTLCIDKPEAALAVDSHKEELRLILKQLQQILDGEHL